MFGGFDPSVKTQETRPVEKSPDSNHEKRDKKKKKKDKKNKKRPASKDVEDLEKEVKQVPIKEEEPIELDDSVSEGSDDDEIAAEGFELLKQIEQEPHASDEDVRRMGYNEDDFEMNKVEFTNCVHEYVAPRGYERPKDFKRPTVKPKTYKFTLDKFQDRAVECIERGESVLVAAHTSAGKTAVAEYAIAQSLARKQRVIYTSPIKALSNQKYRELQEEFVDVGLMTGDVTINESASCLVMTTEILRTMLYNGSEVTREMSWVIFDEVHYMRDKERGVVWEETIILLPPVVKHVFLSATIPNAREFCEWIVRIKQQPCNVVYTDFRPTPLQHYLFPTGASGIYLVVDEKGNFRENNFSKAIQVIEDDLSINKQLEEKKQKNKQNKQTASQEMRKLITLIVSKGLDPCIVFSFSKRECEAFASSLKNCEFNSEDERDSIEKIFKNAISTLSDEDQMLPQITMMLPLLKRGIGIHHGGLLPIVKEVIELLFQEGLLKVLFTTETFSMGINMPARTVVFTSIEKFDGDEYRWISGGEYIQMSGRAGRRGLDDRGITILMANKKLEPDVAKQILKGKSDPLYSSFHLGYNMLLNMMRIEDIQPEDIIMQSFHQFQNERVLPEIKNKLTQSLTEFSSLKIPDEALIKRKSKLVKQQLKIKSEIRKIVTLPENMVPFLVPGRLIKVSVQTEKQQLQWGWGILANFSKQRLNPKNIAQVGGNHKQLQILMEEQESHYVLDVYLYVKDRLTSQNLCQPGDPSKKDGRLGIVPVVLHPLTVESISSIQVNLPHNHKEAGKTVELMYFELLKRFDQGNSIPELDPVKDMEIESNNLVKLVSAYKSVKDQLAASAIQKLSGAQQTQFNRKSELKVEIKELEDSIRKASQMIMSTDLVSMKRVMRRLDMSDKHDVPTLKGKVACGISASDEILITEMLFSGIFNDLQPQQIAALLSCLIYTDSKGSQEGAQKALKHDKLGEPFQNLQKTAAKVATVMIESKIQVDKEEYVAKFKPDLMELTLLWCEGAKFSEICSEAQDIYEGSIIRAFRRLDKLIDQLIESAKIIGNADLKTKFEEAQKNLKRGIVFTASLYL